MFLVPSVLFTDLILDGSFQTSTLYYLNIDRALSELNNINTQILETHILFLSGTKTHTLTSHLVPRPARFLAWQLNSPSMPSVTWMAVLMVVVLTMIVVMIKHVKRRWEIV